MNDKERDTEIQTFLALFNNDCKQKGSCKGIHQQNGRNVGPSGRFPESYVVSGKEAVNGNAARVENVVDLEAHGQQKVVQTLQGNDLSGNEFGVKGFGLLLGSSRRPCVVIAPGAAVAVDAARRAVVAKGRHGRGRYGCSAAGSVSTSSRHVQ
jgi:hypothetical protein